MIMSAPKIKQHSTYDFSLDIADQRVAPQLSRYYKHVDSNSVRVFKTSPESAAIQIRRKNDYMHAPLSIAELRALRDACNLVLEGFGQ